MTRNTMIKLINMTDAGFSAAIERMQSSQTLYSGKDWLRITERISDVRELIATAKKHGHDVYPEQIKALIAAYRASDQKDWPCCQHGLNEFFKWEIPDQIWEYDLSSFNVTHLIRWHYMLLETGINTGVLMSPSRFFHLLVKEQIVDKLQLV